MRARADTASPACVRADATRAFRAWERDHAPRGVPSLPIFCITANVLEEHRLECETAGMCGFITKVRSLACVGPSVWLRRMF
jgi:CheY-like chemotaxis protein